jgi:hypothetical protein
MGIFELIFLAGAAALGVWIVEVVIRRTDVGAMLVLGLMLERVASPLDLSVFVGPIRFAPDDFLLMVLLTATIARALRIERLTPTQRLFVALLLLVMWAVARGVGPFGVQGAVNEARRLLRFLVSALYFSTMEPRRDLLHRLGWLWLIAALALAAIVVARWAGNVAGLSEGFFEGSEGPIRVVHSDQALFLAQGALIALPLFLDRTRKYARYLAPALLACVVLLQHRTVWVATIAGTIYLLYRAKAIAKRLLPALVASGAVFAVLVFTVFGGDEEVADQLAGSAQRTDTFEWRVQGWQVLLEDAGPQSLAEVATGRPYGTGWERSFGIGRVVEVSPHNFFIESFLRVGVLGVATLLAIYALALLGTRRVLRLDTDDGTLLSPSFLHVVVAMQLPYYITYTPDTAQGMLLGLACAAAVNAHRGSREDRLLLEARR